jgi:hypothetical protein
MGCHQQQWMPFWPPLLLVDKLNKYINFYIILLNQTKSFNSSLGKYMRIESTLL